MNISAAVKQQIGQLEPGQIFGYEDISKYQESPSAVVKSVSRLAKSGDIKRLGKGRFYRPKKGLFGELKPSDSELLKSVLYKGNQRRGYVTGIALYNQLGLTTQVPRVITVATEGGRQIKDFGTLRAKLVKSRAPVKEPDVMLLQYLDVLRDIKAISDTDVNKTLARMRTYFYKLDSKQVKRIKNLTRNYYPPSVIALTGYLLERTGKDKKRQLMKSLNPLTRFNIGLDNKQWPGAQDWKIQ